MLVVLMTITLSPEISGHTCIQLLRVLGCTTVKPCRIVSKYFIAMLHCKLHYVVHDLKRDPVGMC